jgi:hypothetical protein
VGVTAADSDNTRREQRFRRAMKSTTTGNLNSRSPFLGDATRPEIIIVSRVRPALVFARSKTPGRTYDCRASRGAFSCAAHAERFDLFEVCLPSDFAV